MLDTILCSSRKLCGLVLIVVVLTSFTDRSGINLDQREVSVISLQFQKDCNKQFKFKSYNMFTVSFLKSWKRKTSQVLIVHNSINMKQSNGVVYTLHNHNLHNKWLQATCTVYFNIKYTKDCLNVVFLFHSFIGLAVFHLV